LGTHNWQNKCVDDFLLENSRCKLAGDLYLPGSIFVGTDAIL